jgi:hypothetical protein
MTPPRARAWVATATPTIADTVQAAYASGLRAATEVRRFLEADTGAVRFAINSPP